MLAATAAFACSRPERIAAQTNVRSLRVAVFPGAGNALPFWVGSAQGFFARAGLEIALSTTPGSVALYTRLGNGTIDLAHSSFDNVVAYDVGSGEAPLPPGVSFTAFMGGDDGFLHLVSRSDRATIASLRGGRIALDALTTGYGFVVRDILARNGMGSDDYTLVAVGAGTQRLQALRDGSVDAAILSTPFDAIARGDGMNVLVRCSDIIGPYQGNVGAVTRSFFVANADTLRRYISAYVQALDWMHAAANRSDVVGLLVERGGFTSPIATALAATFLDPTTGYARRAAIDPAGVRTVLALRERYGAAATIGRPTAYYDTTAYDRVVK
jgi:ABC-type nitrate/sulfonate/bicarbonate transport system substrate-binding protein